MQEEGAKTDKNVLERSDFRSGTLWRLYEYWHGLSDLGDVPDRKRIDPVEIPADILPYIFIIDVDRSGPAPGFVYRLAGTQIVRNYGTTLTGQRPRDAFPDHYRRLEAEYMECVMSKQATVAFYPAPLADRPYKMVERLTCPCRGDSGDIEALFGALSFSAADKV